jgi:hypothetical protein
LSDNNRTHNDERPEFPARKGNDRDKACAEYSATPRPRGHRTEHLWGGQRYSHEGNHQAEDEESDPEVNRCTQQAVPQGGTQLGVHRRLKYGSSPDEGHEKR